MIKKGGSLKKKRIYIYTAILLGAGFTFTSLKHQNENIDLLTLENIEALADSEVDSEGRITCYSSFQNKGSGTKTVKDCATCMDEDCTGYSDKGKCKI